MLSVKLWEVGPVAWSHLHQMCQQSTFLIYSFHNFFVMICILDYLILNPHSILPLKFSKFWQINCAILQIICA